MSIFLSPINIDNEIMINNHYSYVLFIFRNSISSSRVLMVLNLFFFFFEFEHECFSLKKNTISYDLGVLIISDLYIN